MAGFIVPLHSGPSRLVLDDFAGFDYGVMGRTLRSAAAAPPHTLLRCQALLRPGHYTKGRLHPIVEAELPRCPLAITRIHYPSEGSPPEDRLCGFHAAQLEKRCSFKCRWRLA
jgi:hypothetical protein